MVFVFFVSCVRCVFSFVSCVKCVCALSFASVCVYVEALSCFVCMRPWFTMRDAVVYHA